MYCIAYHIYSNCIYRGDENISGVYHILNIKPYITYIMLKADPVLSIRSGSTRFSSNGLDCVYFAMEQGR